MKVNTRLKLVRKSTLILLSLVISIAIVTFSYSCRQEGARSATDAYIPIRNITAQEAAALIEWSKKQKEEDLGRLLDLATFLENKDSASKNSGIHFVDADEDSIWIATSFYIFPTTSNKRSWAEVVYKDKRYQIDSTNWEHYDSLYKLDRNLLEVEIGIPIQSQYIHPGEYNISFSSEAIPRYFVTEVIVIATVLFLLCYLLSQTINLLIIIPSLFFIQLAIMAFTTLYSPAFLDADLFHQRIVLEEISSICFKIAPLSLALTLSCLFLAPVSIFVRALRKYFHETTNVRYWSLVFCIAFGIIAALFTPQYISYRQYILSAQNLLQQVEKQLTDATQQLIVGDPGWNSKHDGNLLENDILSEETIANVTMLFERTNVFESGEVIVLLPVEDRSYIYLSSRRKSVYADKRTLKDEYSSIANYQIIEEVIKSRRPFTGSFIRFLSNSYVEARTITTGNQNIRAVLLLQMNPFTEQKSTTQEILFSLFGFYLYTAFFSAAS